MLEQISIALATYNGVPYLEAFLDSLAAQRRLPDELVVSDDASDDETLELLESFAARSPFPLRLLKNDERLGVVGNFSRALTACRGDLIALADQDDVWLPEKLDVPAEAIVASGAWAVFSDAEVVDFDLVPLGYTMWQQVGFTKERRRLMQADRPWEVLFKDPVVTGATLIFRRELLPFILPIPDSWVHDAWIAQIAASQGQLVAVDEVLALYRQHGSNAIGGRRRTLSEQMGRAYSLGRLGLVERELRRYRDLRDHLASFPASGRRDVMLALAEAKLAHLERRHGLSGSRLWRWPTVWREWLRGNYGRFAKDWRNVAADLLMP